MDHRTGFEFPDTSWPGDMYSNNTTTTSDFFAGSDHDFSSMLQFTPSVGDSQLIVPNMSGNLQPSSSTMPGHFVTGTEFPFPRPPRKYNIPHSNSTDPIVLANIPTPVQTLPPAALAVDPYTNFSSVHGLQHAAEYLAANFQVQQNGVNSLLEDQESQSTGQKRAHPPLPATNPDAIDEPKPKRRRGARKKVRTEEELRIKRENHLQRNRDAAQKCRQKKKLTEAGKKEQMIKERQDNHIVWSQIAMIQHELETFHMFAAEVDNRCDSDEHKETARTSLDRIVMLSARLQDQIDMCNQRRAEFGEGYVMKKLHGEYVQQDSRQDGPESMQDAQSPAMSTQGSAYNEGHSRSNSYATSNVGNLPDVRSRSRPMTDENPQPGNTINTDVANGTDMSRNGSSGSLMQPDSAIGADSPSGGGKKNTSVDDEGIVDPDYAKEPLPQFKTPLSDADTSYAIFAQLEETGILTPNNDHLVIP